HPATDAAARPPPPGDEREDRPRHAEDRREQAHVAEGHRAWRRELMRADRVAAETDDQTDGRRGGRAAPDGPPDRPGTPAGLQFSFDFVPLPGASVPRPPCQCRPHADELHCGDRPAAGEEIMTAFQKPVTTEAELRALIGTPSPMALAKEHGTLDVHCREFVARSPFLLLATSGATGQGDGCP